MIQLVITDINVISTVIPNRKAEAFAAAAQSRINQLFILKTLQFSVLEDFENANLGKCNAGKIQSSFIRLVAELENLRQGRLRNRLVGGELIQQVSDRKFHGGRFRIRPS